MEHNQEHQQYTCTMHPEVVKDAPGKCPICGMKLVPVVKKEEQSSAVTEHSPQDHASMKMPMPNQGHHTNHDHGGHAHHEGMIDDFKKRFYIVLALTVPIMALSPMIQQWLHLRWSFIGSSYLLMALSTVSIFMADGHS